MIQLFLASQASVVLPKIASMLPKNPQEYTVSFIPNAADIYNNPHWVTSDKIELQKLGFHVIDLNLNGKTETELKELLKSTDIIFVAGGNTFYLLQKCIESGFDKIVKEKVAEGTIYIGSSAGSVIAGPDIESVADFDDRNEAQLNDTKGFGFIESVILPHYRKSESSAYHKVIQQFQNQYKFLLLTDQQMVYVNSDDIATITV